MLQGEEQHVQRIAGKGNQRAALLQLFIVYHLFHGCHHQKELIKIGGSSVVLQ